MQLEFTALYGLNPLNKDIQMKTLKLALISAALFASTGAFAQLKVTDWAAKTGPLFPHSGIVESETEIGLVDAQQSKA